MYSEELHGTVAVVAMLCIKTTQHHARARALTILKKITYKGERIRRQLIRTSQFFIFQLKHSSSFNAPLPLDYKHKQNITPDLNAWNIMFSRRTVLITSLSNNLEKKLIERVHKRVVKFDIILSS